MNKFLNECAPECFPDHPMGEGWLGRAVFPSGIYNLLGGSLVSPDFLPDVSARDATFDLVQKADVLHYQRIVA